MAKADTREMPRLTRWEIVGAWLHVWTAPRGLEVPPVPWRKLALAASIGAAAIAFTAALVVPRVNDAKRRGAAERARLQARADAAELARLRRDQLVHRAAVPAGSAARATLERAITQDARARAKAKTITGPVLSTTCEAATPSVSIYPDSRVFKCFVMTATGLHGEGRDILGTGYPFVATFYARLRQVAWCKENPHADEKGSHNDLRASISKACAGRLAAVLG